MRDIMNISAIQMDERVKTVHFTEETISVDLMDGRTITVPLVWYPLLLNATPEQRQDWEICGGGYGLYWEDIDEDLSTSGMLRCAPSPTTPLPNPVATPVILVKQKHNFNNLDLVYAAGLYDYLSPHFATRLTKIMFDMLRPQGTLLVANFVPDHRDVGYMETFMQWNLIYCTESQLVDVAKAIPASEIAQKRTFFESNGNIIFLELVKA